MYGMDLVAFNIALLSCQDPCGFMFMCEHLLCVTIENENSSGEHMAGAAVGIGAIIYLGHVFFIHIIFRLDMDHFDWI